MAIQLIQSGIGDADISFGEDDFDGPVVRVFYSLQINLSQFNGKYIANNLPPRLHKAGQVTLLHSGYVVRHEFVEFFKKDMGVFCIQPDAKFYVNVYPVWANTADEDCPPGTPAFYENWEAAKLADPFYRDLKRTWYGLQFPDLPENNKESLSKLNLQHWIAEVAPFKWGILPAVNQVFIEVFSPGITLMVEIAE